MDVDWVWDLFRNVPRQTHPEVSFSARDASSHDFEIRQINDHVYEVCGPVGRRPSIELVFFHGLRLESSQEPHIDTWLCRDTSEFWLTWILDAIPTARILTVSYDGHAKRTDEQGRSDMYVTTENLLQDLIGTSPAGAEVGQNGCPVVLVGHCLGGIVMKQLCVYANSKLNLIPERLQQPLQNFLDSTQGFFFYASPHQGTSLADMEADSMKGPLFVGLTTLNTQAARQNEDFRMLCQNRGWGTFAIGESHAITQGKFKGLFVEEGSARQNVDQFYTVSTDHTNVCRPESTTSSNFTKLLTFVTDAMTKATLFVHECELPECAIELDSQAWDVQRKLLDGANLGIFGMGGIGKTTLAKKIFNNISKDFDYTCFLENVKDINKIPELKDSLFRNFHFKGKMLDTPLAQFSQLRDKKTLIVLDGIDSQQQLDVLPRLGHFLKGSCVIITSRDKKFLKSLQNCITHEVDFLNPDVAKKLFCFHVFGSEPIPNFLVEHVNEVVRKCHGLPLTLEVVGRHLRGHTTEVHIWKETLQKLSQAEALEGKNDIVWASLQISYDSLSKEEQQVFVEAATVFFLHHIEHALDAWSGSVKYPHTTLETLVNRSMVKVLVMNWARDGGGSFPRVVWVHEQLRDMAKAVADDNILTGYTENARLMVRLLNTNQVKATTKAIELSDCVDVGLRLDSLLHLQGLRFLCLDRVLCEGSLRVSTRNLSVLACKDLIRQRKWWEALCCLEILCPERLPTFNINLTNMDNLAVLVVQGCVVPNDFPEALGNLANLRRLWLENVEGLDYLPKNFGNLSRLRVLGITSLQALKLPEEFGNLLELEELVFHNIRSLKLPESVGNLCSLVKLAFTKINGLAALPDSFGHHLQNLTTMTIVDCPLIQRLPSCFSELSKLEDLYIHHCLGLEELGETFGNLPSLRTLVLQDLALKGLPANFGRLCALEELIIRTDSFRIFSDDFIQLPALKHIIVSSNELETLPNGFRFLKSLENMEMVHCSKLEKLPEDLGRMSSLRQLRLHDCKRLRTLPESLGKSFLPELELRHEVKTLAGDFSQGNATAEPVRLIIYGCPLLDDSVLGSLSGVHVLHEGGSGTKLQLDEDNALASSPFPGEETQLWSGYWTQGFDKGDMTLELRFGANHEILGGGLDTVGQFTCTGKPRYTTHNQVNGAVPRCTSSNSTVERTVSNTMAKSVTPQSMAPGQFVIGITLTGVSFTWNSEANPNF